MSFDRLKKSAREVMLAMTAVSNAVAIMVVRKVRRVEEHDRGAMDLSKSTSTCSSVNSDTEISESSFNSLSRQMR